MGKQVGKRNFAYRAKRHIRFNFERSSENMVMDSPEQDTTMYKNHIIIVDKSKSFRKNVLNKIAEHLNNLGGSMIDSRNVEGIVKGGENEYTFVTWDSRVPLKKSYLFGMFPEMPIRRDKRIYERKVLNLEDSVQDVLYGPND